MSLSVQPFFLQLPSGYSLSASSPATTGAAAPNTAVGARNSGIQNTTTSSAGATGVAGTTQTAPAVNPVDVVGISNTVDAGGFGVNAGDIYRVSDLFQGQTGVPGKSVAGYRLALGAGDGTLTLDGTDVTSQTSFTADEFSRLTYTAGASFSQSLVAVAQIGTVLPNGTLSQMVDSPAVRITASVVIGTRSINAMSALITPPDAADADVVNLVKEVAILTGFGASPRPTLETVFTPRPTLSSAALAMSTGAYNQAGATAVGPVIDLASFDPAAIGGSVSPDILSGADGSLAAALLLLDGTASGSF